MGSGSAASSKRPSIRSPECSPKKTKKPRENRSTTTSQIDDFLDGWRDKGPVSINCTLPYLYHLQYFPTFVYHSMYPLLSQMVAFLFG